jgi:TetR/AcrR family transcriptional repressor of lmrAB and yxaGH operons
MPTVIVNSGKEQHMSSDSRASMVRSAASLIGAHGISATSFSDVLGDSGAPRGSIYHHFPDGKKQLAEDAIRWTSERVLGFQRAGAFKEPADVVSRFIGMWRQVVVTSNGSAGCAVAGVAVDTDSAEESDGVALIDVVRATFQAWITLLTEQLQDTGVPADSARSIATTVLAGMEGALILCRAERSVEPLDAVAGELMRLVPPVQTTRRSRTR